MVADHQVTFFFFNLTYKEWFTSGEKNNICLKQSMNKGED